MCYVWEIILYGCKFGARTFLVEQAQKMEQKQCCSAPKQLDYPMQQEIERVEESCSTMATPQDEPTQQTTTCCTKVVSTTSCCSAPKQQEQTSQVLLQLEDEEEEAPKSTCASNKPETDATQAPASTCCSAKKVVSTTTCCDAPKEQEQVAKKESCCASKQSNDNNSIAQGEKAITKSSTCCSTNAISTISCCAPKQIPIVTQEVPQQSSCCSKKPTTTTCATKQTSDCCEKAKPDVATTTSSCCTKTEKTSSCCAPKKQATSSCCATTKLLQKQDTIITIAEPTITTLHVQGMSCCASCGNTIALHLNAVAGVQQTKIYFSSEKCSIAHDPSVVSPDTLVQKVNELGFVATMLVQDSFNCMTVECKSEDVVKKVAAMEGIITVSAVGHETYKISYNPDVIGPRTVCEQFKGKIILKSEESGQVKSRGSDRELWRQSFIFSLVFTIPIAILAYVIPIITPLQRVLDYPIHAVKLGAMIQAILCTPVQTVVAWPILKSSTLR